MRRKVHIVNAISHRRAQGHGITAERFPDAELSSAESDMPVGLHFPDLIGRVVLDRRQLFSERARTRLITTSRHGHVQSFMRSHVIVAVTPFVKPRLHLPKVSKDSLGQDLDFQTAM